MADGAAKIIQGLEASAPWLKQRVLTHLMSRDPKEFWTSGQWMTEKRGGSDVGKVAGKWLKQGIPNGTNLTLIPLLSYFPCVFIS